MAVNDNDRVTSRRLKEFWQLAKTWIQNFVSNEIDTSEETMSSTMDTKILAAKPNYLMPNVDDQIGVGYGRNEPIKSYCVFSTVNGASNTGIIDFVTNVYGNATYGLKNAKIYGFKAFYKKQDTAPWKKECCKTFFSDVAGRMAMLPPEFYEAYDTENDPDFSEIIDEAVKSTWNGTELISPIIEYNGHTYQGKISYDDTASHKIHMWKSIDGSAFEELTPDFNNAVVLYILYPKELFVENGAGWIEDGSVTENKIATNAIVYSQFKSALKARFPKAEFNNDSANNISYAKHRSDETSNSDVYDLRFKGPYDNFATKFELDTTTGVFTLKKSSVPASGSLRWSGTITSQFAIGLFLLKTDLGYYFSPCYIEFSTNFATVTICDTSILTHATENNAEVAFQYYKGGSVT